jgi:cytochrome c oxidase assembly protein subunit 15
VALVCATFPLIWVGGLVTTYDAGMAVPDWPNTFGYNLFLYPWQTWLFGPFDLFIEHGHRLLASGVGLITIGLVIATFLGDSRPWMRIVSVVALLGVIGQGALGGMRVLFDDRQLAMVHGCVGPAFFALTAAIAVFTSRWWHDAQARRNDEVLGSGQRSDQAGGRRIQRLSLLTAAMAYLQLVLGAGLRHVPIDATAGYFRTLVVFHVIMALAVLVHCWMLRKACMAAREVGCSPNGSGLVGRATAMLVLVTAQIGLGFGTWIVKWGWPSWFADWFFAASYTVQTNSLAQALTTTAHVANGSLVLAIAVAISVRSLRMFPFLVEDGPQSGNARDGERSRSMPMRGALR